MSGKNKTICDAIKEFARNPDVGDEEFRCCLASEITAMIMAFVSQLDGEKLKKMGELAKSESTANRFALLISINKPVCDTLAFEAGVLRDEFGSSPINCVGKCMGWGLACYLNGASLLEGETESKRK